jgi:hypothetical protein
MDNISDFTSIKPRKGRKKKPQGRVYDQIDVTKLSDLDDKGKKKPILRSGSIESGERLYLSEKHEQYCRYRADSYTPQRAYALCYPLNMNPTVGGNQLEKKPEIIERIKQLQMERASMAKLVDPQESLVRWNEIFLRAQEEGDISTAIIAQKQIDKINGAETAVLKQQLEVKGLFRGDNEEEWVKNAKNLFQALFEANVIDGTNSYIKEKMELREKEEKLMEEKLIRDQKEKAIEESIPKILSPSAIGAMLSNKDKDSNPI